MYKISAQKRAEILNFYFANQNNLPYTMQIVLADLIRGEAPLNDIMLELYTYFHAIPDEINYIYELYQFIKAKFPDLEARKILEIASGVIPSLSYMILKHEKMQYQIHTMDPLSLQIPIKGVKQEKREFTSQTNIKNYNLLLASCPCNAFDTILQSAIQNQKEFCVQTCSCNGSYTYQNRFSWLYQIDVWLEHARKLEDNGFIIEKDYIEFSRLIDAPIITARKRKITTESHQ